MKQSRLQELREMFSSHTILSDVVIDIILEYTRLDKSKELWRNLDPNVLPARAIWEETANEYYTVQLLFVPVYSHWHKETLMRQYIQKIIKRYRITYYIRQNGVLFTIVVK